MTIIKTNLRQLAALWFNTALWLKILLGMFLGIVSGVLLGNKAEIFQPIGTLFVHLLEMLVIPLIFCSVISGMTSMEDSSKMGRIGGKALLLYLGTAAVSVILGLFVAFLFQPGTGMGLVANTEAVKAAEPHSFTSMLLDLIPTNPIHALASGNVLQTMVFAIFLGLALNLSGTAAKPAINVISSFTSGLFKLVSLIISLAPYGIFAMLASATGRYGTHILEDLAWVVFTVFIACLLHIGVICGLFVSILGRFNPLKFLRGIFDAQSFAFSTSSSSATLPISILCAEKHLGLSRPMATFLLPLGTAINMDGTAIYQGVCAIFVAQAFGITLDINNYISIVITATLASIGTAGIPGGGLIMLSMVLSSAGLPLEGVALLAGIDRLMDMARTVVNVTGDLMVATVVAQSEHELDVEVADQHRSISS